MIVGGRDFDFGRNEIESRMRGEQPEAIRKHTVEVNGVEYPPKQVLGTVTGWPRTSYTTMEAQRVLRRLGFTCREYSAANYGFDLMPPMRDGFDAKTLKAVADLLDFGQQHDVGVVFIPDDEGWRVGYMYGNGGGDLSSADDLHIAAKAAIRPLKDFIRDVQQERAERFAWVEARAAARHDRRERHARRAAEREKSE